jgi:hypothetical protein
VNLGEYETFPIVSPARYNLTFDCVFISPYNELYFVYKVAMIVGLSLGVDHVRKSTITSVAASMNRDATKYFSEVTVHSTAPTAECFPQSFADHLSSALMYFKISVSNVS